MIIPTIGRVVLVRNRPGSIDANYPEPALVCFVHEGGPYINVGGFDAHGMHFWATSVTLIQDAEPAPPTGVYAEWMPYQKAQAAKFDALEPKLGNTAP